MSSEREENLYEVLQVDPGASQEVIQGAYRALLKDAGLHPDLGGAEDRAKAINEAYSVLGKPEKRQVYDRTLNTDPRTAAPGPPGGFPVACPSCGRRNLLAAGKEAAHPRCEGCGEALRPRSRFATDHDHAKAFRLGIYLFDKGLYDRALQEFRQAVRIQPRSPNYQFWQGRCFYEKRLPKDARAAFKAAAVLAPQVFHYQFWVGQSHYAVRDFAGAQAGFLAAAKIRPDHPPTLLRLATCHLRLRQYPQAVEAVQKATKLEPGRVEHHNWLGLSLFAAGECDAAEKAFRQAERLKPDNGFSKKFLRKIRGH